MKRYVICYDITDDKRRRLIYELLKDHGQRVQYSIFECFIDRTTYARLKFKLTTLLGDGDSLIIYPLCRGCEEQAVVVGRYRSQEADEGFIL